MSSSTRNAILAIVAVSGTAASVRATVFTFVNTCGNSRWYAECTGGPCPTPPGGWNTWNNWGYHGCAGGLPLPGPADDVVITGYCEANGNINIASLTTASTTGLVLQGSFAVGAPFTNTGTVTNAAGTSSIAASITNQNTWLEANGYTRYFDGVSFTNEALLDFQYAYWVARSGTNQFTNDGTFVHSGVVTSDVVGVPFANNGRVQVNAGSLRFGALAITSGASARYGIAASTSLYMNNCTLAGTFIADDVSGAWYLNAPVLTTPVTLNAPGGGISWNGGNLDLGGFALTNAPGSLFTPIVGTASIVNGSISNGGTWRESNGWLRAFNNVAFTNESLVEFGYGHWRGQSGVNSLLNKGTLRHTGNITSDIETIPFRNESLIEVPAGHLRLMDVELTSAGSGRSEIAAGASITLNNCVIAGSLRTAVGGSLFLTNPTLGSDVPVNATGNGVTWNGGNLALRGFTLTNEPTSLITLSVGTAVITDGGITNQGTWRETNGYVRQLSSVRFDNTGLVDMNYGYWRGTAADSLFTNRGELRVSGNATSDLETLHVINRGAFVVQDGALRLSNLTLESDPGASYQVAAERALRFYGVATGGWFNVSNVGSFEITSLSLAADTTLNATSALWVGGNWDLAGHVLTNQGTITLVPGTVILQNGTVVNRGVWREVNGYTRILAGTTFQNAGDVIFDYGSWQGSGGQFINNGLLRTTGATLHDINALPVLNDGLMSLEAGTLRMTPNMFTQGPGGVLRLAAPGVVLASNGSGAFTFAAGSLEGIGQISAPVINSGAVVRPGLSTGTLSANAGYTQSSAGALDIEIAGPAAYDLLAVSGAAALGGTLQVRLQGGYSPPIGQAFTILAASGGVTSTFSTHDIPSFSIEYLPGSVRVIFTGPTCDPDVNCDGAINGFDIEAMEQAVNGDMSNFCQADADYNHDGAVNGFDIEAVEQGVNGAPCP